MISNLLKLIGIALVFALFIFGFGFFFGQHRLKSSFEHVIERDTVFVTETIVVEVKEPVIERVTQFVERFVHIHNTDTIFIEIPRVERVYEDSTFFAVVSGIEPRLDTLKIFQRSTIITETERIYFPVIERRRQNWSIGLQVGAGTDFNGFTPYVGIGVQRNLFSW